MEEKREGGDLNPRDRAVTGLAILRLTGLGHLRFSPHNGMPHLNLFVTGGQVVRDAGRHNMPEVIVNKINIVHTPHYYI